MSEIPARAKEPTESTESGGPSADAPLGDAVWQSSPPGSIYDYIKVASFSIGPDGLVDQWSLRAEQLLGIRAEDAVGSDPIEAFIDPDLRERGQRKMTEILDGREWTGVVPFRAPDEAEGTARHASGRPADGPPTGGRPGQRGLAEVYVMPTRTEDGEKAAVCIVVDVRVLRSIETDLAASQAIFGQSPFGFLLIDPDLTVRRANQRFASIFGGTPDDHRGKGVHDYLPRAEADRVCATLRRVLETGDSITDMHVTGFVPGSEERRHWSVNLYRVHSGSGRPIGVAWLGTDITARRQAAREAANARRNLALLNEAGARIGNSLDLETTARELLDVVVPGFCDLATVDLYQGLLVGDETPPGLADGSAELRRVAFSSAVSDAPFLGTGERVKLGAVHHYPFNSPCADALRTARPRSVPAEDGGLVQSTLAVPMVAHDTVVGLVQFARTKGSEPFGDRDRDLAVELAARAAVCIDNARLYRREHERALILQRSLLPPGDPEASGLDIACRYLPGEAATGRASEVGGDWFDVIELAGGRTALVVGDVMGSGIAAAASMGRLRTATNTLAALELDPAQLLGHLERTTAGLDQAIATCLYAVHDPHRRRCLIANAGHLPPVRLRAGRPPELLDLPTGVPLGVGGVAFSTTEVGLEPGDRLVFYTDGLVETRRHPLDERLAALLALLEGPDRPLEEVCDLLLRTLHEPENSDDVALLIARATPPARRGGGTLSP